MMNHLEASLRRRNVFFTLILCTILLTVGGAAPEGKSFQEKIPAGMSSFEMILIPAGEVKLPGDKEAVKIKPFYMSKYEVTWEMYDPFMLRADLTEKQKVEGVDAQSRPSKPYGTVKDFGDAGYPCVYPHISGVKEFCKWMSARTGKKYRLPTEAEWTYACRAGGEAGPLPKDELDKVAWFEGNSDEKPHPVGKKQPNAFGLYDMLGNLAEWVVRADGTTVIAGGAWTDAADEVSCHARKEYSEDWQSSDPQSPKSKWWLSDGTFVGFRIVCEQE
jgi:formylglycine-generating enzyme required for sulfatase activity